MALVRAFFAGIGTGAGVAWPLFGITFGVLGASIGGPLSLILGGISILLFFAISIPIFYFSYTEEQKNELSLLKQLNRNQKKLHARVEDYLQCIYTQYIQESNPQSFYDYFNRIIDKDLQEIAKINNDSSLYLLLNLLRQHHELLQNSTPLNVRIKFVNTADTITKNIPQKSIPFSNLIIPAFFGFVGTFGSVAGCSAGIAGLLTGLGIFTSFAAFPILGWSILGAAVIFGVIVAIDAAEKKQEQYQTKELNDEMKKMHHQLNKAILEKNLNANLLQTSDSLTSSSKKTDCSTHIKEQIFSELHHDKLKNSKSSLRSISFLNSTKKSSLVDEDIDSSYLQKNAVF